MAAPHKKEIDPALRVKAIESILAEKGLIDSKALDATVDLFENRIGPRNGAQVVAKAWTDPAYKARLLDNATAAIEEKDYGVFAYPDTHAHGLGEKPQHCYSVRELWGDTAAERESLLADRFDDYRDPA